MLAILNYRIFLRIWEPKRVWNVLGLVCFHFFIWNLTWREHVLTCLESAYLVVMCSTDTKPIPAKDLQPMLTMEPEPEAMSVPVGLLVELDDEEWFIDSLWSSSSRLHRAPSSLWLHLSQELLCQCHGLTGLWLHLISPPFQLSTQLNWLSTLAPWLHLSPVAPPWSPGPSVSAGLFDSTWVSTTIIPLVLPDKAPAWLLLPLTLPWAYVLGFLLRVPPWLLHTLSSLWLPTPLSPTWLLPPLPHGARTQLFGRRT